jgi:hypothetical protein
MSVCGPGSSGTLYVGLAGSDSTGSGSLSCPYATIAYAQSLASAGTTIGILDTPWPENFTYADGLTYAPAGVTSIVQLTGTVGSGGGSVTFNAVYSHPPLSWNLTQANAIVTFFNLQEAPNAITVTGHNSGCRLILSQVGTAASFTGVDCGIIVRQSYLTGSISSTRTGSWGVVSSSQNEVDSSVLTGSYFLSSNTSAPVARLTINAGAIIGVLTLNGLDALVTSTPGGFSSTTLVQQNSAPYPTLINGAGSVSYAPAVSAEWASLPGNVKAALDALAASGSALGGSGTATFALGSTTIVGTGATVSCYPGHLCDAVSGTVQLITGSGISAAGVALTITLPRARTNIPNCWAAFTSIDLSKQGFTPAVSQLTISSFGSNLIGATGYTIVYDCNGV